MKPTGNQLETLAVLAQEELLLVAPFVKFNVLQRILSHVSPAVAIQIVTRWRVDEIVAGVSDLDVWLLVTDRPNTLLWLRSDLHAKYYRADRNHVLVGSANLTNSALGWSQQPNLELLIESQVLTEFEVELFRGTVQVNESIYQHIRQIIDEIPKEELVTPSTVPQFHEEIVDELNAVSVESWLPSLRHPEKLYIAYKGKADQLGTGSRIAAESDLRILNVPPNLDGKHFDAYVGVQLLHMPIVQQVDKFVEEPQRFGAVRDFLKTLPCANQPDFDADIAWQTLMRWLLYFLPARYALSAPNHSEVFRRNTS